MFHTNDQPWFDESVGNHTNISSLKQTLFNICRHKQSPKNYQNFSEARCEVDRIHHAVEKS